MGNSEPSGMGKVLWMDLTVPNATEVRDFYHAVAGWEASGLNMGEYEDFCMQPPGADGPICGICHARGSNADMPAAWMIYITVADIDQSVEQVKANGGEIVVGPKGQMGKDRYCVIKDPGGAFAALFQPAGG